MDERYVDCDAWEGWTAPIPNPYLSVDQKSTGDRVA